MAQPKRSQSSGRSGSGARKSGTSRSGGSRSAASRSGSTARASRSTAKRTTSSKSASKSTASRSRAGTGTRAKSAGTARKRAAKGQDERIRELNDRIIDAGKQAGTATLDLYEGALKSIADVLERSAGASEVDWVSRLLTSQADFIRDIAKYWTGAARKSLK
jgi:hypothetical protein